MKQHVGEIQQPIHKLVYQLAAANLTSAVIDHTRQTEHRLYIRFPCIGKRARLWLQGNREAIQECI